MLPPQEAARPEPTRGDSGSAHAVTQPVNRRRLRTRGASGSCRRSPLPPRRHTCSCLALPRRARQRGPAAPGSASRRQRPPALGTLGGGFHSGDTPGPAGEAAPPGPAAGSLAASWRALRSPVPLRDPGAQRRLSAP